MKAAAAPVDLHRRVVRLVPCIKDRRRPHDRVLVVYGGGPACCSASLIERDDRGALTAERVKAADAVSGQGNRVYCSLAVGLGPGRTLVVPGDRGES